jgi:hypothetical protein
MPRKLTFLTLSLLAVLFFTVLPGCGPSKTARAEGEPEYAPAIVDEVMQAFNKGDYATYSKYFDTAMKRAVSESVFTQMRDTVIEKIGKYESREFVSTGKESVYTVVNYNANFSKEQDVSLKFVFLESGEDTLISGLWFNSPKLNE